MDGFWNECLNNQKLNVKNLIKHGLIVVETEDVGRYDQLFGKGSTHKKT